MNLEPYFEMIAIAGVALLLLISQWVWLRGKVKASRLGREEFAGRLEEAALEQARGEERLLAKDRALEAAIGDLGASRMRVSDLERENSRAMERCRSMEERVAEQKVELVEIQKKLTSEFENLANRILDEKGKTFVVQNKASLDALLLPLSERIGSFRERVETSHAEDLKDRAVLKEQLRAMGELNRQMGEEAKNLTTALKGQVKTQGNWGEMILERVLEKSGLVAGREYDTQVSLNDETGKRFQPDVLIRLPDEKHLVVDSKVSLIAYERYANAPDRPAQEEALKEHILSLKAHVTDLSKKGYESLYGIKSPDFVLMFVPIEPAFTAAMHGDDSLFEMAFRNNVVLVTPSTLLVTLRTVANLWRQEKQTLNALEIARKGGDLYDKFVGFYTEMEEVGRRIGQSQQAHEEAMKKLSTGRGNLVRRVEELRRLGARTSKSLPKAVLDELEQ